MQYDHKKIEKKWQDIWAQNKIYTTPDSAPGKENFYLLVEFPYPSGNLHVGHWYAFAVPDILARFQRMQGKNVLYPIGFDAFGLPAENAAIKNKVNPRTWTDGNIKFMKGQIESMGTSFDWSREVATYTPEYYKWTQWLFLQLYQKGLVYQKETAVNWCPNDKTVLANEQVVDGKCERCGHVVEQRQMLQWNIKITDYADRLIDDLEPLDWPNEIKESQKNWIGRSEGAEIDFQVVFGESDIKYNYIFLHGKGGSPESDFWPWLKVQLERRGHRVQAPAMPNPADPSDEEQADHVQKNCTFDEHTILLGHSFGGIVALRLLERGVKVEAVTLIGTPTSGVYLDGKDRPSVTKAAQKGFNSEKINASSKRIVLLYDTNDHVVPLSDGEALVKQIGGHFFTAKAEKSHFNAKIEPEVLRYADPTLTVFTTRPDTLFGATYLVLAPEHPWVTLALGHKTVLENNDEVASYVDRTQKMSDMDRQTTKEKTGAQLKGVMAINPATNEKIPMFIADYVLPQYGTGAIMAVPAHDERDYEFAKKFGLPIRQVVSSDSDLPYTGTGTIMNSASYDGLSIEDAKKMMIEAYGRRKTTFRLRDWIVSRQRYWGVPIPMIHCEKCGAQPVPDAHLPVVLPDVEDYLPEGSGKSPLAKVDSFVNVKCPKCGGAAKRETDTLDTFVDSSWYFLRYTDPKNAVEFASREKQDAWLPVDLYSGGAEHTTMHLLYSRFWHKALYDIGLVKDPEPYKRRMNRSLIMGPDGQKMSKSRGNVIDPDEVVNMLGADTVRMYLAFIGPYAEVASYPWNPDGVVGVRRFLERVARAEEYVQAEDVASLNGPLHKAIKKIGEDITLMKFNTGISQLMILQNAIEKDKKIEKAQFSTMLQLLAPFAPHITEELWNKLGNESSIHTQPWPAFDAKYLVDDEVVIAVQIDGKTRGEFTIASDADKAAVEAAAKAAVAARLDGKTISRTIVVPKRLVNFVLEA
ncbi:MAG: leuS [Candidatus Kaiserbacteria bacterium]|nr:leuS [Candidatus Kaiserbacteria bacterium]